MSKLPYRHVQIGVVPLLISVALVVLLAVLPRMGGLAVPWLILVAVMLVTLMLSVLTVKVDANALSFRYGRKVGWGRRFPVAEIAHAAAATSEWWEGIGIRFTTRGRLYNVAPGPAVELRLRSGDAVRIGTNEPERLLEALAEAGVDTGAAPRG